MSAFCQNKTKKSHDSLLDSQFPTRSYSLKRDRERFPTQSDPQEYEFKPEEHESRDNFKSRCLLTAKLWAYIQELDEKYPPNCKMPKHIKDNYNAAHAAHKALNSCGRSSIFEVSKGKGPDLIKIVANESGKVSSTGMAMCKRSQCQVCGAIKSDILFARCHEWLKDGTVAKRFEGNDTYMMTLTRWHTKNSCPEQLLQDLLTQFKRYANKFRKFKQRHGLSDEEFRGYFGALEITHGGYFGNGLHFHFHIIVTTPFSDEKESDKAWLFEQRAKFSKPGHEMPIENEKKHFIEVPKGKSIEEAIFYLCKGLKETGGFGKKLALSSSSKKIFDIDDNFDLEAYIKFFKLTNGKRFFRYGGCFKQINKIEMDREYDNAAMIDVDDFEFKKDDDEDGIEDDENEIDEDESPSKQMKTVVQIVPMTMYGIGTGIILREATPTQFEPDIPVYYCASYLVRYMIEEISSKNITDIKEMRKICDDLHSEEAKLIESMRIKSIHWREENTDEVKKYYDNYDSDDDCYYKNEEINKKRLKIQSTDKNIYNNLNNNLIKD